MTGSTLRSSGGQLNGAVSPEAQRGGRLRRALLVGCRSNAFHWYGSQALLTRSTDGFDRAAAELSEISALLGNGDDDPSKAVFAQLVRTATDHVMSIEVLRSWWSGQKRYAESGAFRQFTWEANGRINRHRREDRTSATLTERRVLLERCLPPGFLRDSICPKFDEDEKGAFELGESIDQGIRPPDLVLRLPIPDAPSWSWFNTPPYLGSGWIRAGELPPDASWQKELARRWLDVLGERLDLECHMKEMPRSSDFKIDQYALVVRLLGRALGVAATMVSQSNRPGTPAASDQPVAQSDSVPAAPDFDPFPLQFDDQEKADLKITNSRGDTARFRGKKQLFDLVKYVFDRTVDKQPCADEVLVTEFWPQSARGTTRNNSLSSAITNANVFLQLISCKLCTETDGLWVRPCDARG